MKLLFDWDFYVYQAAWLCQTRPKDEFKSITDRDSWELKPLSYAYIALRSIVKGAMQFTGADEYDGVMSDADGSQNFRKVLCSTYKAQRVHKDRPLYYYDIREHIQKNYPCIMADETIEADDLLGIMQTKDTVIVSKDKDMRMIPGKLLIADKKELLTIADPGTLALQKNEKGSKNLKGTGFKWFCAQMLLGDAADNIPKIKRNFGDVAVYDYLKNVKSIKPMWEAVKAMYEKEGKTEEELLIQAKLLWIMREMNQVFEPAIVDMLSKEAKKRAI